METEKGAEELPPSSWEENECLDPNIEVITDVSSVLFNMQQGDHMFSNKRRAHSSSNISSHSSSNLSSHSGPKSSSNIFSSVFSALPVLKHSQKTVLDHNLFLIHDCFSSQELSFQLPVHSTEIDPEGYMLRGRRSNRDAPKKVFDDFTSILSDIESGEGSSGVGESDDSDDEGMEDDGDSEDEDYETGRTSASKKRKIAEHEKGEELPFKCPHCPRSFTKKLYLEGHMVAHTEDRFFQCPHCKKTFGKDFHLKSHITHRHSRGGKVPVAEDPKTGSIHSYQCAKCGETYSVLDHLTRHVKLAHTSTATAQPLAQNGVSLNALNTESGSGPSTLSSSIVPAQPVVPAPLNTEVANGKQFHCHLCSRTFSRQMYLNSHLVSHSTHRPFKCPHCSKQFGQEHHMKSHITHKHVNEGVLTEGVVRGADSATPTLPYRCPCCRKGFRKDYHLKSHIYHKHKDNQAAMEAVKVLSTTKSTAAASQLSTIQENGGVHADQYSSDDDDVPLKIVVNDAEVSAVSSNAPYPSGGRSFLPVPMIVPQVQQCSAVIEGLPLNNIILVDTLAHVNGGSGQLDQPRGTRVSSLISKQSPNTRDLECGETMSSDRQRDAGVQGVGQTSDQEAITQTFAQEGLNQMTRLEGFQLTSRQEQFDQTSRQEWFGQTSKQQVSNQTMKMSDEDLHTCVHCGQSFARANHLGSHMYQKHRRARKRSNCEDGPKSSPRADDDHTMCRSTRNSTRIEGEHFSTVGEEKMEIAESDLPPGSPDDVFDSDPSASRPFDTTSAELLDHGSVFRKDGGPSLETGDLPKQYKCGDCGQCFTRANHLGSHMYQKHRRKKSSSSSLERVRRRSRSTSQERTKEKDLVSTGEKASKMSHSPLAEESDEREGSVCGGRLKQSQQMIPSGSPHNSPSITSTEQLPDKSQRMSLPPSSGSSGVQSTQQVSVMRGETWSPEVKLQVGVADEATTGNSSNAVLPYRCGECGKSFSATWQLKNHVLSSHSHPSPATVQQTSLSSHPLVEQFVAVTPEVLSYYTQTNSPQHQASLPLGGQPIQLAPGSAHFVTPHFSIQPLGVAQHPQLLSAILPPQAIPTLGLPVPIQSLSPLTIEGMGSAGRMSPLAQKTTNPQQVVRMPTSQQTATLGKQHASMLKQTASPPRQQTSSPQLIMSSPRQLTSSPQTSPPKQQTSPPRRQTSAHQHQTSPSRNQTSAHQHQTSPSRQQSSARQHQMSPPRQQSSARQHQTSPSRQQSSARQHQMSPLRQQTSTRQHQTSPPRQQASPPRQQITAPKHQTSQLKQQTSHPREQTSHPREQTSQLKQQTSHPREQTSQLKQQTSHPREQTSHPREQTSHPREQTARKQQASSLGQQKSTLKQQTSPPRQQTFPPRQQTSPGQQTSPPRQQTSHLGQQTSPPRQQTSPGQQTSPPRQQTSPGQQTSHLGQQMSLPEQQMSHPRQLAPQSDQTFADLQQTTMSQPRQSMAQKDHSRNRTPPQSRGVQGTGAESRGVQGTGAESRGVQGTGAESRGVQRTGTESRGVQGTGAESRGVQRTGTESGGVQGTGTESRGVQGTGAESRGVQGTGMEATTTDKEEFQEIDDLEERHSEDLELDHAFDKRGKEKKYKCPHCPRKFSYSAHLTSHLPSHANERPHQCPHCTKQFVMQHHLHSHITHSHIRKEERSLLGESLHTCWCPECGKGFLQKNHLANHMHKHKGKVNSLLPGGKESVVDGIPSPGLQNPRDLVGFLASVFSKGHLQGLAAKKPPSTEPTATPVCLSSTQATQPLTRVAHSGQQAGSTSAEDTGVAATPTSGTTPTSVDIATCNATPTVLRMSTTADPTLASNTTPIVTATPTLVRMVTAGTAPSLVGMPTVKTTPTVDNTIKSILSKGLSTDLLYLAGTKQSVKSGTDMSSALPLAVPLNLMGQGGSAVANQSVKYIPLSLPDVLRAMQPLQLSSVDRQPSSGHQQPSSATKLHKVPSTSETSGSCVLPVVRDLLNPSKHTPSEAASLSSLERSEKEYEESPLPTAKQKGEDSSSIEHSYTCPYCTQSFRNKSQMAIHVISHENGGISKHSSPSHSSTSAILKCKLCQNSYESVRQLKWHMQHRHHKTLLLSDDEYTPSHPEGRPRPHKCKECGKTFVQKNHLDSHIFFKHVTDSSIGIVMVDNKYPCPSCSRVFDYNYRLKSHIYHSHSKGISAKNGTAA